MSRTTPLHNGVLPGLISGMNSSDLKRLQKRWYKILKEEGFKDIETLLPNGVLADVLAQPAIHKRNRFHHPYIFEEHQSYYRLCSWFLHEYSFTEEVDRMIWECHSDGLPIRDICEKVDLSVRAVHRRLHKLIRGPFQDYRKMVFHDAN
jgi:hypothetical protein